MSRKSLLLTAALVLIGAGLYWKLADIGMRSGGVPQSQVDSPGSGRAGPGG